MHSSKFIRVVMLFVILVCLPLQGLAAVTMAACQTHDQSMQMSVDADSSDDMSHCNYQTSDHTTKKSACDKCLTCHISVAQAIIPVNILVEFSGMTPVPSNLAEQASDSVSSPPFHPPRPVFS